MARVVEVRGARRVLAALAVAAVSCPPRVARGHTVGLSSGEYARHGNVLEVGLSLARGDAARVAPLLDVDGDGHVTAREVAGAGPQLRVRIVDRIDVTSAGGRCPGALVDAALADQDGLLVRARYTCRHGGTLAVDVALLDDLPRGHRHVARLSRSDGASDRVLDGRTHTLEVVEDAAPLPAEATVESGLESLAPRFVWMGLEHILTGPDHLLFVLGLVLVPGRWRSLALVITAFTAGHSLSLAAAAMGHRVPGPAFVEPAIALSIAYVGVENLLSKRVRWRPALTFAFGLVHGLGFAGALAAHPLTRAHPVSTLLAFNLGVELGQLAALAVAVPLLLLVGNALLGRYRVRDVLSAGVAVVGVVWFVARLAG